MPLCYPGDHDDRLFPDYEGASWYLSNHPNSHFVTSLVAARSDVDCRYALRNNEPGVHHLNGATERRVLASAAELRAALERLTTPAA